MLLSYVTPCGLAHVAFQHRCSYFVQAAGAIEAHSIHTHFPELASWFVVLTVFTWSGAIAATARVIVLSICLFSLAIGSMIACCLFAYNGGSGTAAEGSSSGAGLSGGVNDGYPVTFGYSVRSWHGGA